MVVRSLIARALYAAAAVLLASAVTLMAVQVFRRFALNAPWAWAEEVSRYFFVWAVYLGTALALAHGTHIRVTVVTDALGGRAKRASDVLTWIVNSAAIAFLLYWSVDLVWKYRDSSFHTIPELPKMIFYLSVPVAMAIMLLLQFLPGALNPASEAAPETAAATKENEKAG